MPSYSAYVTFRWLMILSTVSAAAFAQQQMAKSAGSSLGNSARPVWRFGGTVSGGLSPWYEVNTAAANYNESLNFYKVGLEAGRTVTGIHGCGVFAGRGEVVMEIIPFWLAHVPSQNVVVHVNGAAPSTFNSVVPGHDTHGISLTPLLARWNLVHSRVASHVPWFQAGGGLLWTTHDFPVGSSGSGGSTSRINFTPQIGIGDSIFLGRNGSIDFTVKAIHISSAGLGVSNPGVNATVEFGLGYSWRR